MSEMRSDRQADRIALLRATLEDCRELLDGYADISSEVDEDGSPFPNKAMSMMQEIDDVLEKTK